ncbi:hypothetical protein Tco_1351947 [Tanacetum coccineum]
MRDRKQEIYHGTRALIESLKKAKKLSIKKMTREKDDRPAAGGIDTNNGMNDTNVIPLPGASHHMTGIIEDLSNLKEIVQWPVELPDGNIAMAKKEGDVCFDNGFVLRNVLYVHGLTYNLLSVPQLLDEGNCIVQFATNICVIQDLTLRTVIGAGERRDGGLFYFREMTPTRAFKTTTTIPFDLWHQRLGHPSLEVLKLLPQDKYVADILKKFDFATVKTASTPLEPNKPLLKDEEADDVDVHLYRSMIGSLMYLTASRPDIIFAVCNCARFQVSPKTSHLHAVKRIFRYLKSQPKLGLWYLIDSPFELEAFSDSDYAGVSLDRKSTIGAEYVAVASCYGQVLWIQNQMLDYGFNFMNTRIYIDNESIIWEVHSVNAVDYTHVVFELKLEGINDDQILNTAKLSFYYLKKLCTASTKVLPGLLYAAGQKVSTARHKVSAAMQT